MRTLKGETVLITGAAAGIGSQLAEEFARAGCRLILIDIDEKRLAEAAVKLQQLGAETAYYVCDVSDRRRVEETAAEILRKFGALDILVNNAGVGYSGEMALMRREDWERLLNINFWGALNFIYAFLPSMLAKRKGRIANVSSGQAFFRLPTWGAYAAVKTCLAVFSEVLHFEMKRYGVRVTTVYPYMVNTGFYQGMKGETFLSRKAFAWLPYYSQSPAKVAKIIFRAVAKGKQRSFVHPFNWLGFLLFCCPPLHRLVSSLAARWLAPQPRRSTEG